MKEDKLFQDYTKFMNNSLAVGYTKWLDESTSGMPWYNPQHGVYHPNKPREVRAVFNCIVKFQGKPINRELLSRPDLKGQLIRVLTRFCAEKIAFMANLEAM